MVDIPNRSSLEQALDETSSTCATFLQCSPLPIWVYDLETLAFLAVNDAAVQHYGFSREEFLAMTVKDIRPLEEVPGLLEDELKHPGHRIGKVWRHWKKDRTDMFVEVATHEMVYSGRS